MSDDGPVPGRNSERRQEAYGLSVRSLARCRTVARGASGLVLATALAALAGWTFSIPALTRLLPELVAMNPATAVALAASAVALGGIPARGAVARLAAGICGAVPLLIGAAVLGRYLFGWDAAPDTWLFRERLAGNRMAPNTATALVFCGGALLLLLGEGRARAWAGQVLGLAAGLLGLIAAVGYAYSVEAFYGIGRQMPMALNTALALLFLSGGLLCIRPDRGLMAIVTSEALGGTLARRLFPASILVPVLLGWIVLVGYEARMYDVPLRFALLVATHIGVFGGLILFAASALNRADGKRRLAEAALQRANVELERRVEERTAALARANAELRASEERYRRIVETAYEGIWVIDAEARTTYVNPRMAELLGYRVEEMMGRHVPEFLFEEDRERWLEHLALRRKGVREQYEFRFRRRNGAELWCFIATSPIFDDRGAFVGSLGMLTDITERKRAAEELEAARQRLLQAEVEKKQFSREVLRVVTQGKFHLAEYPEIPTVGRLVAEFTLDTPASFAAFRHQIQATAAQVGMKEEDAIDFVLAAGEAATNAIKHAVGAHAALRATEERLIVRVTDHGAGIRAEEIPATVLQPGYSTKVSLGMGYTLMLRLVDTIWLATGPEGTVVQLESWIHPEEHRVDPLRALLARF